MSGSSSTTRRRNLLLRSESADQGALHRVDGQPRHFAIVRKHCQHVDEAVVTAAKPRAHDGAGHPASDDPHGGAEVDQMSGLLLGPALFLIETMRGLGT